MKKRKNPVIALRSDEKVEKLAKIFSENLRIVLSPEKTAAMVQHKIQSVAFDGDKTIVCDNNLHTCGKYINAQLRNDKMFRKEHFLNSFAMSTRR